MQGLQITTKIPGQTKTQKKDRRKLGERATGRAEVKKTGELMKDWQEYKGQTDRVGYFSLFIFFRALERKRSGQLDQTSILKLFCYTKLL